MTLVYGFGGLRDQDGTLRFDPRLPRPWDRLRFNLRFHDRQLVVDLTHDEFRFTLVSGEPLTISVRGTDLELTPDDDAVVPTTIGHVADA
jgi:alpha,alpha-trehalose phosphorylase